MTQEQKFQSGQVLLITLLVLSVATTIALSVIGRTTLETQSISQIEESTRAFNAAEAGIEVALKSGLDASKADFVHDVNYNAKISDFGNATGVYQLTAKTEKGSTETIWLANHDVNGVLDETQAYASDIDICMRNESPTLPAMVVSVYYKDGLLYKTAYGAYDPVVSRQNGTTPYSLANNFTEPTATTGGCNNANMFVKSNLFASLGIDSASVILLMLRIRPVYNDATIAVNSVAPLPK